MAQTFRQWRLVGLAVLIVLGIGVVALLTPASEGTRDAGLARGRTLNDPTAWVEHDPQKGELIILVGPIDLPPMAHHVTPPTATVQVPIDGMAYGFWAEVVDATGRRLPDEFVHHINLTDPAHSDLFFPISHRVGAASKETGPQILPWFLFGYPITQGQEIVVWSMLHNPTHDNYRGVLIRFHVEYVKANRPWPLFRIYPFNIDVGAAVGTRGFDLPPGWTTRSFEGSPAIKGRVMGIGSHLHNYAKNITLMDATTGKLLWEGCPIVDDDGTTLEGMTVGLFYRTFGIEMHPDHLYRVSVTYHNPTDDTLLSGGMGTVAGAFKPARGVTWPAADRNHPLYILDRRHYMQEIGGRLPDMATVGEAPRFTELSTLDPPERWLNGLSKCADR